MKKKHIIAWILLAVILIYIGMNLYNPLRTVEYDIKSTKIPQAFDGFRIVQITDFHCKSFGNREEILINQVKEAKPDIIVITGDVVNNGHPLDNFRYLIEGITPLAPVYFVTGNHEHTAGNNLLELINLLIDNNVVIMDKGREEIVRGDSKIIVSGVNYLNRFDDLIINMSRPNEDYFNLLLNHGTDDFPFIAFLNYDLILSGHGHGGIIRLPFIGGVIGTNNNLFPEYDYGKYVIGKSTMISSSGLGDSILPRFNNPREIVAVTLHSGE